MTEKEYRWYVKQLQATYPTLKLSFEQTEQLYQIEQVEKEPEGHHYFTDWERLDFELATMQRILTAEQLAAYLPLHAAAVEQHVSALIAANAGASASLAYSQEVLRYNQEVILPTLYADPDLRWLMELSQGRGASSRRLAFAWQECDRGFQKQWKKTVIQHYRRFRKYGKQLLVQQRLAHELQTIRPDYRLLLRSLYKPARQILKVTLKRNEDLLNGHWPRLLALAADWSAYLATQHEARFGPAKGFVHQEALTDKQHRQYWLFQLLWLSRTMPPPAAAAKHPRSPEG